MTGYAVVDVETTGVSAERNDRIVEIAVVLLAPDGAHESSWSTLVNPLRDVGPTRIHGITATHVVNAPTFDVVAPHVLSSLQGRLLVAHNAPFDARFLTCEFLRAGYEFDELPFEYLCTMSWASTLGTAARSLRDVCAHAGVELTQAHSALADAMAAAELLQLYLDAARPEPLCEESLECAARFAWPSHQLEQPLSAVTRPRPTRSRLSSGWLDRIVAQTPRAAHPAADSYLALLQEAFLDRHLSVSERESLIEFAEHHGLSRGVVLDLHHEYLNSLVRTALADSIVTTQERELLNSVAQQLGLPQSDVDAAVESGMSDLSCAPDPGSQLTGIAPPPGTLLTGVRLERGMRVTFTGDTDPQQTVLADFAQEMGLEVGGVSKKTAVLVAADVNTTSGKACKARQYRIPIITVDQFMQLVRQMA